MPPRPSYKSFVVERHIEAPRDVVWETLLDFLFEVTRGYTVPGDPPPHGPGAEVHFRLGQWDLVERTLTLEPPWRRVYEIAAGAPVKLYHATTALRDDGDECHFVWSYLAEAFDDGSSDEFLERARAAITTAADMVVARVESRSEGDPDFAICNDAEGRPVLAHEHDIENLLYRYGEYVDLARFDELAELFRHGAIRSDRGSGDLRGDDVATFYRATNRVHADSGTLRTRHIASNVIVGVDDAAGTATARSYFVVCQQTSVLPLQPIVSGRYHDTFHKVDDEWCFDVRMIYVDLIGNMSEHLSFDLRTERAPRF